MIRLYSGTPGSGKSLHSARVILAWLTMQKKNVIANFPINMEIVKYSPMERRLKKWNKKHKMKPRKHARFYYFTDDVLSPELLMKYARKFHKPRVEGQTLLIFDECSSDGLFNNRSWQNQNRNAWITFFRQHRKLGYSIIFIAQSDKLIDKAIRTFVEYEVKHRKVNNYKSLGRILGIVSGGSLFAAIESWYQVREKTGTEFFRYSKELGELYDSYKVF